MFLNLNILFNYGQLIPIEVMNGNKNEKNILVNLQAIDNQLDKIVLFQRLYSIPNILYVTT